MFGDDDADEVRGGPGRDFLHGSAGDDILFGGGGRRDDDLFGGDNDDVLDGGPGIDTPCDGADAIEADGVPDNDAAPVNCAKRTPRCGSGEHAPAPTRSRASARGGDGRSAPR